MRKISAKRKTRTMAFYVGAVLALALVWMHWGTISHGIILFLDKFVGMIHSLSGG